MYSYRCINCGWEIKPEEVLYNITPIITYGMISFKIIPPVYATNREMKDMIDSANSAGLSLRKIISIMINKVNYKWEKLRNHCKQYNLPQQKDEAINSILKIINSQHDDDNGSQHDDDSGMIFGENTAEIITQIKENFICTDQEQQENSDRVFRNLHDLKFDPYHSYAFKVTGQGGETVSQFPNDAVICKYCKKTIPIGYAFQDEQRLIGFGGIRNAGKTTAMIALAYHIKKNVNPGSFHPLFYGEDSKKRYEENMKRYELGYELAKTDAAGENIFNISFEVGNNDKGIIYTLVDVPGEMFQGDLDIQNINNIFPAILKCDTYIWCADTESVSWGHIMKQFFHYLQPDAQEDRCPPMLCLATKIDEDPGENIRNDIPEEFSYFRDHFINDYYQSLNYFCSEGHENTGYAGLLQALRTRTYVTPLTCASYGFNPESASDSDNLQERKDPVPRNIDQVFLWISRIYGDEPVARQANEGEERVAHQKRLVNVNYKSVEIMYDDNDVYCKAGMFCNLQEWDLSRLGCDSRNAISRCIRRYARNRAVITDEN